MSTSERVAASFVLTENHGTRTMRSKIDMLARSETEFVLLHELCRSAKTRALVETMSRPGEVQQRLRWHLTHSPDPGVRKRIAQAIQRASEIINKNRRSS